MATLQLVDLNLDGSSALLQVLDLSVVADPAPTSGNVLRIYELSMRATGGGPVLTGLPPQPRALVDAGQQVTIGVSVDGVYTSVLWTVQDGSLPVELAGSDLEKQFVAPYDPHGGNVVLAVVASNVDGDSDPVILTVGVVPHGDWHLSGGEWLPTVHSDTLGD